MISAHQQRLHDRVLEAPVVPAPSAWRLVGDWRVPVGGLLGIGFAVDPHSGHDLVMTVSTSGHGLFDAVTGEKIARDRDPDDDSCTPDTTPDLTCPGLGPVAGSRIHIAGLFGGGLHSGTGDGWTVTVASPEWPSHRVLLVRASGLHRGAHEEDWWHVLHANYSEFRAAGFSPSGHTLAVATSSDLTLWSRTSAGS
ncbi:hypothetical protein J1792_18095 [Streptomyces triculaminicus]|uniref:Uncharacterized protein n=1 Tax=Streptomyces triculaminicus TaxID=2816232 RepID=A0A939FPX0_9ACTN|nr:hypothetical protein [Streptomyces triculaminicus]MBO0654621.1 hypothetical protein [Streptomyces triculaminicus]